MGVRLVCFLSAIFLAKDVLWLQLVLLAAAVVLPYSAVLFANAGRDRATYDTSPMTPPAHAELPAAPPRTPGADDAPDAGRVVEHDERPAHEHGDEGDGPDEGAQGPTEGDH